MRADRLLSILMTLRSRCSMLMGRSFSNRWEVGAGPARKPESSVNYLVALFFLDLAKLLQLLLDLQVRNGGQRD